MRIRVGTILSGTMLVAVCPVQAFAETWMLESDVLTVTVDSQGGGFLVRDKRSGREWGGPRFVADISDRTKPVPPVLTNVTRDSENLRGEIAEWGCNVRFHLQGAELEVEASFKSLPKDGRAFPMPPKFDDADALVIPYGEGFRLPFAADAQGRDFPVAAREDTRPAEIGVGISPASAIMQKDIPLWGGRLSMPFFGVTDKNDACGWMAVVETPEDAKLKCILEGKRLVRLAPLWMAEFGKAGYPRMVRFVFFDKGGYVAMAKRYRAYAKSQGLVMTFREKAKERPLVERLPGAANVWYFQGGREPSHAKVAEEVRKSGIGRFLWSSRAPAEDVKKIASMPNAIVGRYDVCRDVYYPELLEAMGKKVPEPDNESCRNTSAWPDDIMWSEPRSNAWRKAWGVTCKDGKKRYSAAQCDIPAMARLERSVANELRTTPFTARFMDVVSAVGWEECYNPAHPMTRRVSRGAKIDLLKMLGERFSLVVGSEQGMDAFVPCCDYFEGMMSPKCAQMPHGRAGYGRWDLFRDDGNIPKQLSAEELDRVVRFGLNEKYRIPLFELVYHDCVCSHWYWYDYSNHPICFWKKRDLFNALYGTAPMYIFNYTQWTRRKAEFVESWKRVGGIARDSGFSEMTSHRALTPDREVQETRFANGLVVTVDFRNGRVATIRGGDKEE